jgi:tRNA-specific 2-thiouridylase
MSGGVDSSSTAAILKVYGCKVHGVFIELFSSESVENAKNDARKMASFVGIDFSVIDYKTKFHEHVIKPFVESYCSGKTPLPCSWCNKFIKFSALCEFADRVGVKYVATGHYVCTDRKNDVVTLEHATDRKQDQSYFLHKVEQHQLERACFPLGNAKKRSVRDYAGRIGLAVSEKKSLYDVCFLSDFKGNYVDFIIDYVKEHPEIANSSALQPGNILDTHGGKLGEHGGAFHYTIGQRRGLGISAANPLYVFKIDESNVFAGEKHLLAVKNIEIKDVNFHAISQFFLEENKDNQVFVQFRSTTPAVPAIFRFSHTPDKEKIDNESFCTPSQKDFGAGDTERNHAAYLDVREDVSTGSTHSQTFCDGVYFVVFQNEQYGVSPGQAAVIRNASGTVLAGGVIKSV